MYVSVCFSAFISVAIYVRERENVCECMIIEDENVCECVF